MRKGRFVRLMHAGMIGLALCACAGTARPSHENYGLGHPAKSVDIARQDIDVAPDGSGLPDGRGDAVDGAQVFARSCRSCHGAAIRLDPLRWPYATTLFDYIRRAMPPDRSARLAVNDVYAATAFELWANRIVTEHELIDRHTLPHVAMPGAGNFVGAP